MLTKKMINDCLSIIAPVAMKLLSLNPKQIKWHVVDINHPRIVSAVDKDIIRGLTAIRNKKNKKSYHHIYLTIQENRSIALVIDTVVHELIHVALAPLSDRHLNDPKWDEDEEQVVRQITKCIVALLT